MEHMHPNTLGGGRVARLAGCLSCTYMKKKNESNTAALLLVQASKSSPPFFFPWQTQYPLRN